MSRLRRFFAENIALKLLSLGLALALWITLGGGVQTEIFLAVPVEFRDVPPGTQFEVDSPRVELRIRGLRHVVLQASAKDFSVPVDIAMLGGPGRKEVPLSPSDVQAPASLQVMEVAPAQLTVTVKGPATANQPLTLKGSRQP